MEVLHLALDTSASRPTVALLEGSKLRKEWIGSLEEHHSVSLLAGIDSCLEACGGGGKDLKFISVGIGPGMFTGLRVGIATAKFLADVHSIPVAPVSSLLALAIAARELGASRIWALNDAKSQRVYALHVEKEKLSVSLKPSSAEEVALTPEEAAPQMRAGDLLVGEGALLFREKWPSSVKLAPESLHILRAVHVGEIGYSMYCEGNTISAVDLVPRYLKTGQAHL